MPYAHHAIYVIFAPGITDTCNRICKGECLPNHRSIWECEPFITSHAGIKQRKNYKHTSNFMFTFPSRNTFHLTGLISFFFYNPALVSLAPYNPRFYYYFLTFHVGVGMKLWFSNRYIFPLSSVSSTVSFVPCIGAQGIFYHCHYLCRYFCHTVSIFMARTCAKLNELWNKLFDYSNFRRQCINSMWYFQPEYRRHRVVFGLSFSSWTKNTSQEMLFFSFAQVRKTKKKIILILTHSKLICHWYM